MKSSKQDANSKNWSPGQQRRVDGGSATGLDQVTHALLEAKRPLSAAQKILAAKLEAQKAKAEAERVQADREFAEEKVRLAQQAQTKPRKLR